MRPRKHTLHFVEKWKEKFHTRNTKCGKPAQTSGEESTPFYGTLQKLRIVSNRICYGPVPEPGEEVEQHLTINAQGDVWFSGYVYTRENSDYKKTRCKHFKIGAASAANLLKKVEFHFATKQSDPLFPDTGTWSIVLTDRDGAACHFEGSLCTGLDKELDDISDMVRKYMDFDELYLFDGRSTPDVIKRITLDYHRLTKIKPAHISPDVKWKFVTWDYAERLVIDRETETLEHSQIIGTGCRVSRKYEVEDGISSLLNNLDADGLFSHGGERSKEKPEENSEGSNDTLNETIDYTITVDYRRRPQKVLTGAFDKNGLPDDFGTFADTVFEFIRFYGVGEIFDPSIYRKARRRTGEYIFCSVVFHDGYKSYYYLTDDDSIQIGDRVLVPVGPDDHEATAEVENIEYFSVEDAPFPIEKTKWIIWKCDDSE